MVFSTFSLSVFVAISTSSLAISATNIKIVAGVPTQTVGGYGANNAGFIGCSQGQVAIGMQAVESNDKNRENGLVSSLALRCGKITADLKTNITGTVYTENTKVSQGYSGSVMSGPIVAQCSGGTVLTGFDAYVLPKAINLHKLDTIDSLIPRCSPVSITTGRLLEIGAPTDLRAMAGTPLSNTVLYDNIDCPKGTVVYGFYSRNGEVFDDISLTCGYIKQAVVTVSAVLPTSGDPKILNQTPGLQFGDLTLKDGDSLIIEPQKEYGFGAINVPFGYKFSHVECSIGIGNPVTVPHVTATDSSNWNCIYYFEIDNSVKPVIPAGLTTVTPKPTVIVASLSATNPIPTTTTTTPSTASTPAVVVSSTSQPIQPITAVQTTVRTGGAGVNSLSIVSFVIGCLAVALVFFKIKKTR
jgi:hypothetical protein